MADQDIGEMFLNFMLSDEIISFCVVDITNMRTEEEMVKSKDWRMVNVGAEDDGYYRLAMSCLSGDDVG